MTKNGAGGILKSSRGRYTLKGENTMKSRREIALETKREIRLSQLITKFGFESEPTLYFAEWAWKDINNMDRYFKTAINWRFIEED